MYAFSNWFLTTIELTANSSDKFMTVSHGTECLLFVRDTNAFCGARNSAAKPHLICNVVEHSCNGVTANVDLKFCSRGLLDIIASDVLGEVFRTY